MDEIKPLKLKPGIKRKIGKYWLLVPLFLVVLFAAWWKSDSGSPSVVSFVFGLGSTLKTDNGRVNILLLGIAGGNHEGPNLTDTIMVASADVKSHQTDLISLPRDLWVDEHKAKINTLYQIGLSRGSGLDLAKNEIGDMLGIKIPYAVRVDFNGFIKAVDLVGGLDVNIERSFDDYSYPVPGKENELCGYKEEELDVSEEEGETLGVEPGKLKVLMDPEGKIATAAAKPGAGFIFTDQQVFDLFPCRFEHLSFTNGKTQMDGSTALKFVRSRHGTNTEGTDFARSKRQQLVLQAFRENVLSLGTLSDLSKVTGLIKTLGASVESNIPVAQYPEFIKLVKGSQETKSFVLDTSGKDPLLVAPPTWQYGAWVLIPPDNDFAKIHQYISDIFSGKLSASESAGKKQ